MSSRATQDPFVAVGGIVLHAERLGEPRKHTIVFSNSLGTDARIWRTVLPFLPDRYGVILYDKRGHGLSSAPTGPYTIDDHAQDLLELLDHFELARFTLVGLSVGGMIAQTIAARIPERVAALVLCNTAAKIGDAAGWEARISAVEANGLDAIADSVLERWFTEAYHVASPVAMQGWRNMLARQSAGSYMATCAAIRDADLRAETTAIRASTLCIAGDQDLSTPPDLVRGIAGLIHDARFLTLAGAGHVPCIEQPDALARAIVSHLDEAGV